jgi:hypothetical protein
LIQSVHRTVGGVARVFGRPSSGDFLRDALLHVELKFIVQIAFHLGAAKDRA